MRKVTVQVKDEKFEFFLELLKNLKFVKKIHIHDESGDGQTVNATKHDKKKVAEKILNSSK